MAPGRTLSASDYLWTATPWDATPAGGRARLRARTASRRDAVQVFQPFLSTTRAGLPDIPLWNPYIMGGRPFLANSAVGGLLPVQRAGVRAAALDARWR